MSTSATPRVHILADHIGGGTGRHILSLVAALDREVCDPEVISEGEVHMKDAGSTPVRHLHSSRRLSRFPLAQMSSYIKLRSELRRSPTDILHTYGTWPNLYGRALKRMGHVRCLVENRENEHYRWGLRERRLLRAGNHLPDRVICVSKGVMRTVGELEGIDERRLEVIHNGTPEPISPPSREEARRILDLPTDAFVVGTVLSGLGRAVKGIEYLVAAMPAVLAAARNAWFLIIGERSADDPLEDPSIEPHVRERVRLPGYLADAPRLYGAMDVLAIPSISEGLSITLIEAMSHSVPAVATRVGGNPEALLDGETGLLVEPRDSAELADKIIQLYRDPELRRDMADRSYERFQSAFRIERVAERYQAVYADVIAKADGRART